MRYSPINKWFTSTANFISSFHFTHFYAVSVSHEKKNYGGIRTSPAYRLSPRFEGVVVAKQHELSLLQQANATFQRGHAIDWILNYKLKLWTSLNWKIYKNLLKPVKCALACVASVSGWGSGIADGASKRRGRGNRWQAKHQKSRSSSFFAPKPHGDACYAG